MMAAWGTSGKRVRPPCPALSPGWLVHAGDWNGALAFGLSVAVGLTPQMLPLIVTANLVRGAAQLRRRQYAVRRHNAIQDLGAM